MVEIELNDLNLEPIATGPCDFRTETDAGTEIRVRRHNCWFCREDVYIWKHRYNYRNACGRWGVIGGGAKNGAEVACKACRSKM